MTKRGYFCTLYYAIMTEAGVAQLVEPHVANVVVAGSSPVSCFYSYILSAA